jgi:adenosylcobinamide kinase / adenosylcobinamide-phosphate guanylyltransferase
MKRQIILVTGPARSGKSEWAEHLARLSDRPVLYVATAQDRLDDAEWHQRLSLHRQRRPADWRTVECTQDLAAAIAQAGSGDCLLVDSLGTWLANRLDEEDWPGSLAAVVAATVATEAMVVMVAEETGWGVVPAYPLGRRFRDRLGQLVRALAGVADRTYLVTAGHALDLSTLGTALTVMEKS